jgi:hypothetical protein
MNKLSPHFWSRRDEDKVVEQYHRMNAHGGYLIHKKIEIMTEYEEAERTLTSYCQKYNSILLKRVNGYIPFPETEDYA